MEMADMLEALINDKGAIVSSDSCSEAEIFMARACHRFYVNDRGYGFVLRTKAWEQAACEAIKLMREEVCPECKGPFLPEAGDLFVGERPMSAAEENKILRRILECNGLAYTPETPTKSAEVTYSRPKKCPRCSSPDPKRHPAMQFEGEVQPCKDTFHLQDTPENRPYLSEARER